MAQAAADGHEHRPNDERTGRDLFRTTVLAGGCEGAARMLAPDPHGGAS